MNSIISDELLKKYKKDLLWKKVKKEKIKIWLKSSTKTTNRIDGRIRIN